MENLDPKFFIRLKNNLKSILRIIQQNVYKKYNTYKLNSRWKAIANTNYSYGYVIEALQIKLILMHNEWPEYEKKENLLELIILADELLLMLAKEEKISHLRSDEYKTKQKLFFEKLNIYSTDLFY